MSGKTIDRYVGLGFRHRSPLTMSHTPYIHRDKSLVSIYVYEPNAKSHVTVGESRRAEKK